MEVDAQYEKGARGTTAKSATSVLNSRADDVMELPAKERRAAALSSTSNARRKSVFTED